MCDPTFFGFPLTFPAAIRMRLASVTRSSPSFSSAIRTRASGCARPASRLVQFQLVAGAPGARIGPPVKGAPAIRLSVNWTAVIC